MASPVGNRLPGIVVTINPDIGLIQPLGFERFPAVIGIGDREIISRTNFLVTRGSGTDDVLPEKIVTLFQIGKAPGITQYRQGSGHYSIVDVTVDGKTVSAIRWAGTATNPAQPAAGGRYYISWTKAIPSMAFTWNLWLDENLLLQSLGRESMFSDNSLINPLIAAARIALHQGSPGVITVQLDARGEHSAIIPGASAGWVNPLDPTGAELDVAEDAAVYELDKIEEFKLWVVPLDPESYPEELDPRTDDFPNGHRAMVESNNARWFVHVNIASSPDEARERTLFGIVPQGTVLETLLDTAGAFRETGGGQRFALPGTKGVEPNENSSIQIQVNTRVGDMVPNGYLSAAAAGCLCAGEIGAPNNSAPLTDVKLLGNWTLPEAKTLRGAGVMPFKIRQGLTTLVMPISSDTTSAFTEDLSVQDVADYLRQFLRIRIFDAYRNTKITASTEGAIEGTVKSLLDGLVNSNILVSYDPASVQANQRKDEPRLMELRARVKPAYPLRWIDATVEFTAAI